MEMYGKRRADPQRDRQSHPSATAHVRETQLLSFLQTRAGNRAVQRLLSDHAAVQRYRPTSAMNFGAADAGVLVESNFQGSKKQPWLSLIAVNFDSVAADADGVEMPTGTATATYFANSHALSSFTAPVTGGPHGMPTDPGSFTAHRIEGVGYNDPSAAADIAARQGEGALEGPKLGAHRRYTKPTGGQKPVDVSASMHLAVFYNAGEALHFAPPNRASHGCVHVTDFAILTQLNYHSVIGKTKVMVTYSGAAKAKFTP